MSPPLTSAAALGARKYNLRPRNPQGVVSKGVKYTSITLRRFPPELREMVFHSAMIKIEGKTPQLLIALRADRELYAEALIVYYKVNDFEVRYDIGWKWLDDLRPEVRKMLKGGMRISLPSVTIDEAIQMQPRHLTIPTFIHYALMTLPNITSIRVVGPDAVAVNFGFLHVIFEKHTCPNLRAFEVTFWGGKGINALQLQNIQEYWDAVLVEGVRAATNLRLVKLLGEGYWIRKERIGRLCEVWRWDAEKGKVLKALEKEDD